jgi:hypothetical protein
MKDIGLIRFTDLTTVRFTTVFDEWHPTEEMHRVHFWIWRAGPDDIYHTKEDHNFGRGPERIHEYEHEDAYSAMVEYGCGLSLWLYGGHYRISRMGATAFGRELPERDIFALFVELLTTAANRELPVVDLSAIGDFTPPKPNPDAYCGEDIDGNALWVQVN